jgi:hypothetical protein
MAFKTKLQVVQKIERDLDLEEEEFIQADEMTEYINDALTLIEAHINKLGLKDQYYLSKTNISLVSGTADYALPSNLADDKLEEVVYSNGSTIYKVEPMNPSHSLEEIELLNLYSSTEWYKYRIRNDSSTGRYLQLIPASRETAANVLKVEYLRKIEKVDSDADLIEIPDICLQYLYQYVKTMVYEKENAESVSYQEAVRKLEKVEALMLSTLQGQLEDQAFSKIELDKSIYEEIS